MSVYQSCRDPTSCADIEHCINWRCDRNLLSTYKLTYRDGCHFAKHISLGKIRGVLCTHRVQSVGVSLCRLLIQYHTRIILKTSPAGVLTAAMKYDLLSWMPF